MTPVTPILWYQTVWFEIGKAIVLLIIGGLIAYLFGRLAHKKDRKESSSKALSAENADLKKRLELYEEVDQSKTGNYLIMKKTGQAICPVCWAKDHKAVPIYENDVGSYRCGGCGHYDDFDRVKHKAHDAEVKAKNDAYAKQINDFIGFNG